MTSDIVLQILWLFTIQPQNMYVHFPLCHSLVLQMLSHVHRSNCLFKLIYMIWLSHLCEKNNRLPTQNLVLGKLLSMPQNTRRLYSRLLAPLLFDLDAVDKCVSQKLEGKVFLPRIQDAHIIDQFHLSHEI